MTKARRAELIAQVAKMQNHPALENQDHLTICGFMQTEKELRLHINTLKKRAYGIAAV